MSLPIAPRTLTAEEFNSYTNRWQTLLASADPGRTTALRQALMSGGQKLSNFTYLDSERVNVLLSNPEQTVAIRTKFCLLGDEATFSIIAYGIDGNGAAKTPYVLMGVAAVPASIEDVEKLAHPIVNAEIPAKEAATWILNWNAIAQAPASLTAAPFISQYGPLMGYTFEIGDFSKPWQPPHAANAALWLNFDMHALADQGSELRFSSIVTRNTVPVGTTPGIIILSPTQRYYDVSRPCPPYCDKFP